ncbi:Pkinase-domain-containing protein [Ascodesmis nigricans]|uniref:mitogen-activated protein kinase n=1 Tax=Ascodesmis nigricans TaxID=341454 RepID=A0A4S2MWQ2_9PEZI|nr:Pkinase-domain-containing protein [Ascodesmis nigricans]
MAMVTSRMSQYMPQAHPGSHFQDTTSSSMLGQPSPTNSDFSEGHIGLEDIRLWDERKVGEWLRSVGWQKYDSIFEKNNITGEALLECDHAVLKELGVAKIGDRIRIFVAVKALRQKAMGNAKKRNRDTLAALDNTMLASPTLSKERKRVSRTEPLPQNIYPGTPPGIQSPPHTGNTVRQSQWTSSSTSGSRSAANIKDFCITVYGENGVKRTIDVRECHTPDAIMRRILAKFSKQADNPVLWSLYTITPSSSGGKDRVKSLGDADLLEIVGNNTLPERSRLVLQRHGLPPVESSREYVLARQIAVEQMERVNLANNARSNKVQDITGHPTDEIRSEPQYNVNRRPPRGGDKLPPFFQERPPSEFISSNLAEYFPDHGHKALERTVRNSIRRSRMMSRHNTRMSQFSIASTRSFGSTMSDHSIPPVPTVGNVWLRDQGTQQSSSGSVLETSSRRSSIRRPGSVLMPTVFSGNNDHLGPVPENDVSPVTSDRQSYMSFDSHDSSREPIVTVTDTSAPSAAGFLGTRDSMISTVSTEMDMNSVIDRFDEDDDEDFDEEEEDDLSDGNPKWMRGKLIGHGSFGNVYLGLNALTGELMAVKQVEIPSGGAEDSRKQGMIEALNREIALLKDLQHPNIVQYLASNKEDNCFNIFLEYVPGGSVAGMLSSYGPLREPLIRTFVKQILNGLAYLHGKNIIHRDIKGANVLVDNKGGIKISDFGISKKMEADLLTFRKGNGVNRPSLQGSVYWMAPEVVKQTSYTLKADIWSLGCLIVEMFTGSHPYPDCSQLQAIFQIGAGGSKPTIPAQATEEGKDFLAQTFELDHNKRPTADELLLSPFLRPLVGGTTAPES